MKLTTNDQKKLSYLHPDLCKVINRCAQMTKIPFMVMETSRSKQQQMKNIANHVSQTMHSRHLVSSDGLARAADLVPIDDKGKPIWAWPVYHKFAPEMKAAAKYVGVNIEWGGDWLRFKDGPHFQLSWKEYP